jgi:hypothetical protein
MMELEVNQSKPARRGRLRIVTIGVAVAVLTGAIGFVVGRAATPSPSVAVIVPAAPSPTNGAPQTEATTVSEGTDAPADTAVAESPASAEESASMDASSPSAGAGMYTSSAWEEPQQELLAERSRPDGVTMRVHVTRYPEQTYPASDGWTPAGWCYPSGDLRVGVATPTSVNISWAPFYAEPRDGLAVTTFASGYAEGSPMFGAVVQVGADVESVTFTTASGLTDSAIPANGVALLLVPGPIEQQFSVTVSRTDGSDTTRGVDELTEMWADDEYRAACEPPPPALPAAGEQPADPAAAHAAVLEAWRIAHDFADAEPELRRSFVDDDTGLAEAWEALQNGEYAEAANSATADIDELVFTSPTEAWFRYDILTSITNFTNRYGMARLGADGVWRITRQTICQDIALAPGYGCAPTVATLFPPSAVGDPRYDPTAQPEPGIITD